MTVTTVVYAIVLALFVLAFLVILVNTIVNSKPRPQEELHGPEAIQAAIDRYERSAWRRTGPLTFWGTPLLRRRGTARVAAGPPRKKARRHRHGRHHS